MKSAKGITDGPYMKQWKVAKSLVLYIPSYKPEQENKHRTSTETHLDNVLPCIWHNQAAALIGMNKKGIRDPQRTLCNPSATQGWVALGPIGWEAYTVAEVLRGWQPCGRAAKPTPAICATHAKPGGAYATVIRGELVKQHHVRLIHPN